VVPAAFPAWMVAVKTPGAVGAPEMIPVTGSSVTPGGRLPSTMVNAVGVPPAGRGWMGTMAAPWTVEEADG